MITKLILTNQQSPTIWKTPNDLFAPHVDLHLTYSYQKAPSVYDYCSQPDTPHFGAQFFFSHPAQTDHQNISSSFPELACDAYGL